MTKVNAILRYLKVKPYHLNELALLSNTKNPRNVMSLIASLRRKGHNIQLRSIDGKYEYLSTGEVIMGKKLGYHNSTYCVDCHEWREKVRRYCPECGQRLRVKSRHRNRSLEIRV